MKKILFAALILICCKSKQKGAPVKRPVTLVINGQVFHFETATIDLTNMQCHICYDKRTDILRVVFPNEYGVRILPANFDIQPIVIDNYSTDKK